MWRNFVGTSSVLDYVHAWSWRTISSYTPCVCSANLSLNVLHRLINDDGIAMSASLVSVQYLSHTSVSSRISACDPNCSSSWQSQSNTTLLAVSADLLTLSVLRLNLTWQLLWCLLSAAVRSITQASRVLKIGSYIDASRIRLLTGVSCMRWDFSLVILWQNMHKFQLICATLLLRRVSCDWATDVGADELDWIWSTVISVALSLSSLWELV